jgi:sirohydrochlorin cobaltochelatase
VKRIYHYTDVVAARHPEIEFVKAPYLSDHPAVLDSFAERVEEILAGANLMNCKLCKYREQILGFESEVGLPQESHHHHVEGIGTGASNGGDGEATPHHNHHAHHHHHHHHPYPHADHPLGPRSMKKKAG